MRGTRVKSTWKTLESLETGRNISGTLKGQDLFPCNITAKHMFPACNHQPQANYVPNVPLNFPQIIPHQQPITTFQSQLKCSHWQQVGYFLYVSDISLPKYIGFPGRSHHKCFPQYHVGPILCTFGMYFMCFCNVPSSLPV